MLLLMLSVIGLAAASCPPGYVLEPNTDKCYKVSTLQSSFFSAQYGCTEDGANLASITNAFENSFVAQLLPPFGYFFIGLTRLVDPNKWTWLDETPLYYTNFYPNQNFNESCVAYNGLNDACTVPCSGNLGYVCSVTASSSCPTCPTCNGTCAARCESGWTYFPQTHSCYRTLKDGSWFQAEEDCQVAGAHLASIHSKAENDFVMQVSKTGKEGSDGVMPYIGLRRLPNNTWIWSDGTAVNYTHWHPNRPRDTPYDCAYVFSDQYSGGSDWYSDWESCVCTDVHRAFVSGGIIFATVIIDVLPHVQWLYGTHYNRSKTLPLTYVLICVGFVVSFLLVEIGRRLVGYLDPEKNCLDTIQRLKRRRELEKRRSINSLVALATFSVALGVHSEIRHFELLTSPSHRITVILFGTLLRQLVAIIPFLRVTDPIRQALLSIIIGLLVFILHMVVVYVTVIHLEKLPDYKQTTLEIVFESTCSGVLLYISLIELMAKQRGDRSLFLQLGVFILTLGGMTLLHLLLRHPHYQQPMADAQTSSNYSCDVQQQSPIDFGASMIYYRSDTDPSSVQWLDWTPDDIDGMEVPHSQGDYHGFTIHFVDKPKSRFTASHLKGSYQPYNFHMHWQFYNDSRMRGQGSEHTVKGFRYPGEVSFKAGDKETSMAIFVDVDVEWRVVDLGDMHVVFFNDKYDSFDDAQGKKGGVIVLGIFVAIGDFHNTQFHHMEHAIASVMPNGGEVPESVLGFLDLPGLLPHNRHFYTYTGSLTTPRYSPCVKWTVFTEPIRISPDQYELLFNVVYNLKNARDGQPIVGPVYASFEPQ